MKLSVTPISLMMVLAITYTASAKLSTLSAKVSYDKPEKFLDFRSRSVSTKIDRDRLMAELEKHIQHSVKQILPEGQSMQITFTNIDMAGYIYPSTNDIRTVRQDSDKSLLVFDYSIFDSDGNKIAEGHERLIDQHLNTIKHRSKRYEHTHFKYEITSFSKWLERMAKKL